MKKLIAVVIVITINYSVFSQVNSIDTAINKNKPGSAMIYSSDKQEVSDSLKRILLRNAKKGMPYYVVDTMPSFPGGVDSLKAFINKQINYSKINPKPHLEGRVTMRFVVSKKGKIQNVVVIRGLEPSYDSEAIRIVKAMPRWTPGRQNGCTYPVYYTLSIKFNCNQ